MLVGGEHEDFYDADFCIYNDVFVHSPGGAMAIYGYPEALFPPTDFHTATLLGDVIFVIGSLGYQGRRAYGETPVFRLDLTNFRIDGWKRPATRPAGSTSHRADRAGPRRIRITSGISRAHQRTGRKCTDLMPGVRPRRMSGRWSWERRDV